MPIIRADKKPLFEWVVSRGLIRPALRRMFRAVRLAIDRPARAALCGTPPARREPLIWISPHPSWWDGYLGWLVNDRLGRRDGYLMMDAEFLPRYRFFTWAGVFGVDRKDPRAALESIEYIAGLLSEAPNRALWMFPQGTITPPDRRPLHLYGGTAHILRRLRAATVVPVVWRPVFGDQQHPEVFIRVGTPLHYTGPAVPRGPAVTEQLTAALTAEDDRLRQDLAGADPGGYRSLLRGPASINERWDGLRGQARALLRRGGRG